MKKEEKKKKEDELKDVEKGEFVVQEPEINGQKPGDFHMARMQRLSATNPLRLVIENANRVASPSPAHSQSHPSRPSPAPSQPRSTPTPQVSPSDILLA